MTQATQRDQWKRLLIQLSKRQWVRRKGRDFNKNSRDAALRQGHARVQLPSFLARLFNTWRVWQVPVEQWSSIFAEQSVEKLPVPEIEALCRFTWSVTTLQEVTCQACDQKSKANHKNSIANLFLNTEPNNKLLFWSQITNNSRNESL
jgi:hypothetical protein